MVDQGDLYSLPSTAERPRTRSQISDVGKGQDPEPDFAKCLAAQEGLGFVDLMIRQLDKTRLFGS